MQNSKCQDCGLYRTTKRVCIYGENLTPHKVMIIGEAPGADEERFGKPFQGRSGQLLREELERVGLTDVYITNVVKCRPPANREPTPDELKACRKYLDDELATVKPEFVLALGSTAAKSFLKISKITQDHGKVLPKESFTGMAAFHPAYALRDPSKLEPLQKDLRRFANLVAGEKPREKPSYRVVRTAEDLQAFADDFRAAERFSFDLETTGLFMHNTAERIRCLGIATPQQRWVFPLHMPDSPFPEHRNHYKLVRWLVNEARGKWCIAHNGKFDNLWLWTRYGTAFHINVDTMLLSHTLDENRPHGLKELARTELGVPDYDIDVKEKQGDLFDTEKLYEYNALDVAYTLEIATLFEARLRKSKSLRRLFYSLIMPAARAFEHIELEGFTIDLEKFNEGERLLQIESAKLEKELNQLAGEDVNWNSPKQVGQILFGKFKLKPTVYTDKGQPSTGEEALYNLKDQHPVATKLVEYREATKFLGTYFQGWREMMIGNTVYFSTKLHGTVTGRYSSRLHQTPRDGRIRNCVTAPPGWTFVQGDLSQAELRIAAIASKDIEMITGFRRETDAHWKTLLFTIEAGGGEYVPHVFETARQLGKPTKDLSEACSTLLKAGHEKCIKVWKGWKEGRKKAKGINFGFIYGMKEKKFVEYAKLKYGFEPTLEEAEVLRDAYFRLYRQLEAWHEKQRRLVSIDGYVTNLAGRVRRLPGIFSSDRSLKSEAERQAINSPIQGFIGDLKAMAMVEICQTLPRYHVKVLGEVHDSILMIVRNESLDEYLPKIARIMKAPKLLKEFGLDNLPVPIEADLEVGPWGAGKPYVLPSEFD